MDKPYRVVKKRVLRHLCVILLGIVLAMAFGVFCHAVEEGRPSYTAQAVCAFRAIGSHDPDPKVRNPDHMAEKMLGQAYWSGSGLTHYLNEMKAGRRAIGLPTLYWVTARTMHVDHTLRQAVKKGAKQVVILGAGYDSRAYRMQAEMPQVTFFEVDFPATQEDKLRRLKKMLGKVPGRIKYAPIDFNKQTLGGVLKKAGYQRNLKTFYVWEGVTYYLNAAAVKNTLTFIARNSAPGSQVFLDYMYQPVIAGDYRYPHSRRLADRVRSAGEPWVFGLKPNGAGAFVKECGLSLVSDMGPKEFTRQYLKGSDGVQIGEPLEFLSLVIAKVPAKK